MSKGVKSARGAMVDFDLLKIKQQMATAPKPTVVQARESFVDTKLKRRVRRLSTAAKVATIEASDAAPEVVEAEVVAEENKPQPTKDKK